MKGGFKLLYMLPAAIMLRSLATVFAKKAAIGSSGNGIGGILVNTWTGAELVALVAYAFLWSHVLNRHSLNRVYPFTSLVFGVNLAAAAFIFGEVVLPNHLLGIVVIISGVVIISTDKRLSSDIPCVKKVVVVKDVDGNRNLSA